MSSNDAGDEFEKLIEDDAIHFRTVEIDQICAWGQDVIRTFLDPLGMTWRLGDVKVGNNYCLKLDDPFLQYLDIMPDTMQFMWCTDGHHDSVHPDVASAYLAVKQFPDLKTKVWRDDTTGLRVIECELPSGRKFRIDDSFLDGKRIIEIRN